MLSGACLVCPAEWKNHAPVPALEITLPRAAAFRFQHLFPGGAEFPEVCITGDHNLFGIGQRMVRINRYDAVDQPAVSRFRGDWLGGIKSCILKKLPRRARDDKAV